MDGLILEKKKDAFSMVLWHPFRPLLIFLWLSLLLLDVHRQFLLKRKMNFVLL